MIKVNGLWTDGRVVDMYINRSTYICDDVFGHPQFDTEYTAIGNLLHDLKYNGHVDTSAAIADNCSNKVQHWLKNAHIDIILPIPPTNERIAQPVFLIAEALSDRLKIPYSCEVLKKQGNIQSKNLTDDKQDLVGTIVQLKPAVRKCNILLVDDFYSSGSTANECVRVLKKDPLIDDIYFLAIAKTKK